MEKFKKLSRAEMKNVAGGNESFPCQDQCDIEKACPNPNQECTLFDDCNYLGGTTLQFRCA